VRVSVVIPVKDDDRVFACVESVLACRGEADDLEVVVVNSASEAGFGERLRGLRPLVTVLEEATPGSFRARNRGIGAVSGDAVFFTDADAVVRPGWIREGLRALESGIAVARGASDSLGHSLAERVVQARIEGRVGRLPAGARVTVDTKNLAVRADVLRELRFDPALIRGGDTSFGLRAEAAGFRVGYWPAMRVVHEHEASVAVFTAKTVPHTWALEKVHRTGEAGWPRGHARVSSRVAGLVGRLPGGGRAARAGAQAAVRGSGLLDRPAAARMPFRLAIALTAAAGMAAGFCGRVMCIAGEPEPLLSELLGRARIRE
jgi:hypothetical protein